MTREPVWLVALRYSAAAIAVGLVGFVLIRGASLCFLDLIRRVSP